MSVYSIETLLDPLNHMQHKYNSEGWMPFLDNKIFLTSKKRIKVQK